MIQTHGQVLATYREWYTLAYYGGDAQRMREVWKKLPLRTRVRWFFLPATGPIHDTGSWIRERGRSR